MNWYLIALMFGPPLLPYAWLVKNILTGRFEVMEPQREWWQQGLMISTFLLLSPIVYLLMVGIWSTPIYWLMLVFWPRT